MSRKAACGLSTQMHIVLHWQSCDDEGHLSDIPAQVVCVCVSVFVFCFVCMCLFMFCVCMRLCVCVWIADCFETVQAQLFRLPLTHEPAVFVSLGYT